MLNHGWWPVLWWLGKVFVLLFAFIWLRGTLPRLRYDQFMRLGWKVLIPFSLVWILVVASFRELTNEGRTRLQTLAYVGIPIAVLVLVWSFVTESRANRRSASRRARGRRTRSCRRGTAARAGYPIPVLTGAPTLDVAAVSRCRHGTSRRRCSMADEIEPQPVGEHAQPTEPGREAVQPQGPVRAGRRASA